MGVVVTAPEAPIQVQIALPGSKSLSNRLLIMAALSRQTLDLPGLATSTDTATLRQLLLSAGPEYHAGEGGTTYRFALAYLALQSTPARLFASGRMQQRPIGPLVEALRQLGAAIHYLEKEGYPPVEIRQPVQPGHHHLHVDVADSSQYASALLLIGPYLKEGLRLTLGGPPVSAAYLRMTVKLMQQAGVPVSMRDQDIFVPAGRYTLGRVQIERDWSSAGYWLAIAALSEECQIELPGLFPNSWQGDRIAVEWFHPLGVETFFSDTGALLMHREVSPAPLDLDASQYPDLVPTLLVVAACKGVNVRLHGIDHLRLKESDRLAALQRELKQLHAEFQQEGKVWTLTPGTLPGTPPEIITYNDHRMAMAFAPAALALGQITLAEKAVVRKSYPHFWEDLQHAGFGVR